MKKRQTQRARTMKLVLTAMFVAMGMILPLLTGQIKEIGDSLLPMHLPILLCGLLCGGGWGLTAGLLTPFLRSVSFGMPPLYPNAVWMAAELGTYGLVIGLVSALLGNKHTVGRIYFALLSAMLAGRAVWGVAKALLLGVADKPFTWAMFWAGGFLDAIPGIVLQLILIPVIALTVQRFQKKGE